MTDYSNKTILIHDNGLFVTWASLLAKSFGKVLYYSPWESGYPKSNARLIGVGMDGVTRVNSIWPHIDEVDLFFFPDVYQGELQVYLEKKGKRVWGSRTGEELELDRIGSKEFCKSLGIDIGPYEVVNGLDDLRDYLKENDDQYVKISSTRGDMETFHAPNYRLIEPRLDELEHNLGAKKKVMQFIVEAALDPAIEVGFDGYTIDGQFANNTMYGVEVKDKGFVMQTGPYDEVPKEITSVNDKLAAAFKAIHYRGFWSTEIRVTTPDCTPYMIDPCPRAGAPPNELYQVMVTNWADIIWEGAGGVLVEPEFAAKWGAELLLISTWADKNWQEVDVPKSVADYVKLRYCTKIDGRFYVAPQWTGVPEIGAVVGLGDTMEAAVKDCQTKAEKVGGYYIEVRADSLDEATDAITKLDKLSKK